MEPIAVEQKPNIDFAFHYEQIGSEMWAVFGSGERVRVDRRRVRVYPGLPSAAPPTQTVYEALMGSIDASSAEVLDVGCGSGVGTRTLTARFASVTGIDSDAQAIDFARAMCGSRCGVALADLQTFDLDQPVDAAFVVDVLGHLPAPLTALMHLRAKMKQTGRIAVGEPTAYPAQHLRAPARRAFSPRSLMQLLYAAGFTDIEWVDGGGSFLMCTASAAQEPAWSRLMEGALATDENLDRAEAAYREVAETASLPLRIEALLCLGEIGLARGDANVACEAYLKARELDDADARPVQGLVRILLKTGEIEDAFLLARHAVELDPTDSTVVVAHAMAADAMTGLRADIWKTANELAPDDFGTAAQFARAACGDREFDQALFALERLRDYGINGSHLQIAIAEVLRDAGRIADARLEARLALIESPDDPNVQRLWQELAQSTPAPP